ncbi:hypothetical protein KSMBR1_1540 [Candidatus Kuenenia stuttgartiensis]|uniref:DNA polymerase helix-hairpin-helix motif domain-containing protein n=1 Tax=Kuenenia stuttgartiensis TaxID=174633 RepID=A0A2C9CDT2_KUEST|nr:hypothetical protein KSMBR1_1540 [Candidatus Kuenenia stuttgartiensis]
MNIEILKPDVNESLSDFIISEGNKIRFGLGSVKNAAIRQLNLLFLQGKKAVNFLQYWISARELTCAP